MIISVVNLPFKSGDIKKGLSLKPILLPFFRKRFQETSYFKEKARHRYKIKAKNTELKHRHDFGVARASGIFNMELQVAVTIFVVGVKRIIDLINPKQVNKRRNLPK